MVCSTVREGFVVFSCRAVWFNNSGSDPNHIVFLTLGDRGLSDPPGSIRFRTPESDLPDSGSGRTRPTGVSRMTSTPGSEKYVLRTGGGLRESDCGVTRWTWYRPGTRGCLTT